MQAILLSASALLIAAPAGAGQQQGRDPQTVVITGKALTETQRGLDECLASACATEQEIAATLAHAENLFTAGRYQEAQSVLARATRRNRRFGSQHPAAVADLYRAASRVAVHLGESNVAHSSALDVHRLLKSGLGEDDPRTLIAMTELGDSYGKAGRVISAEDMYLKAASRARALGLHEIEAFSIVRAFALRATVERDRPSEFHLRADPALLDMLIASPRLEHRWYAAAARTLKARIAAARGDKRAIDRLIADLQTTPTQVPVLLFEDSVDVQRAMLTGGRTGLATNMSIGDSATRQMAVLDVDDEWIDVSFRVTPEGRTSDIEVLRSGKDVDQRWVRPVLAQIGARRYAPLKADPQGVMRVERYTFTSAFTEVLGSRMRQRDFNPRLEVLDLTVDGAVSRPIRSDKG